MATEVINGIEVTDYRHPEDELLPTSVEELKQYITRLSEERNVIQADIDSHSDVLRRENNVGMDGPLVDAEQYPRSDIDVVAVRTSRQQVIMLTNDMRDVMGRIERALFKLHELMPRQENTRNDVREEVRPPTRPPFLRVHGVLPDSPAYNSGLRDGDVICQIGSLHKDNFSNLGDVAEIVKLSVNKAVPVKVIRDGTPKTIALKPRPWQGRGVLGCNVVEHTD